MERPHAGGVDPRCVDYPRYSPGDTRSELLPGRACRITHGPSEEYALLPLDTADGTAAPARTPPSSLLSVAEVRVIEAGPERLDAVEPLWLMLSAHHGDLTPPELPVRNPGSAWPARRERYRQALADGATLFFAEGSEGVVGYAFVHPRSAPESLAIDRLLEVETVAVLEEARGEGVGTALMEAVEGWAHDHGFEHLSVSVRTANEGAKRLYERRGFRPLYETMYSTPAARPHVP